MTQNISKIPPEILTKMADCFNKYHEAFLFPARAAELLNISYETAIRYLKIFRTQYKIKKIRFHKQRHNTPETLERLYTEYLRRGDTFLTAKNISHFLKCSTPTAREILFRFYIKYNLQNNPKVQSVMNQEKSTEHLLKLKKLYDSNGDEALSITNIVSELNLNSRQHATQIRDLFFKTFNLEFDSQKRRKIEKQSLQLSHQQKRAQRLESLFKHLLNLYKKHGSVALTMKAVQNFYGGSLETARKYLKEFCAYEGLVPARTITRWDNISAEIDYLIKKYGLAVLAPYHITLHFPVAEMTAYTYIKRYCIENNIDEAERKAAVKNNVINYF